MAKRAHKPMDGETGKDMAARIATLMEQLEYHNYRYYILDQPEISDSTYDQLLIKLEAPGKSPP